MDTKSKKVDRYITDMKELPVESKQVEKPKDDFKPKVEEVRVSKEKEEVKETLKEDKKTDQTKDIPKPVAEKSSPKMNSNAEEIGSTDDLGKPYTAKDIILGVVNLLSIVFLIFLLVKFPEKAQELKSLKVENIQNSQANNTVLSIPTDIKEKSEKLKNLFLDDSGVVDFTVEVEKLKTSNPAIQKGVSFTSQKPIKDKLGLDGMPVIIVLKGDWQSIGSAMNAIESLPYLFRAVNVRSDVSKDDPNVIVLNYGGILYVGDKFTKN